MKPFHVAIDTRRLHDFGIGTYIRNLVRRLADLDQVNQYSLVVAGADPPELAGLPPNFCYAVYRKPSHSAYSAISLPLFLRSLHADLYHIPLASVPFFMPRPYVVTVHDMSNLFFQKNDGVRGQWRLFRFRRGLTRADRIIAVSNATRRDVSSVIGIPAWRIRTIYNAPDPVFLNCDPPPILCFDGGEVVFPPELQRTMDRYQINYPFLLYAGNIRPQKNIPRLVEAFAVVRGELKEHPIFKDLHLIIIGDELSRYPAVRHAVIQTRVEHVVRFLGFVPIETLRFLYQAAQAFVFPSLYEGFGLPPLEAMSCGTPVVTSHVSALSEVTDDAAVIVNPENVFDIARGIRDVLLDRELRQRVVQRGYEQARRFSWERTAAQVLETYQEVAAGRRQT